MLTMIMDLLINYRISSMTWFSNSNTSYSSRRGVHVIASREKKIRTKCTSQLRCQRFELEQFEFEKFFLLKTKFLYSYTLIDNFLWSLIQIIRVSHPKNFFKKKNFWTGIFRGTCFMGFFRAPSTPIFFFHYLFFFAIFEKKIYRYKG